MQVKTMVFGSESYPDKALEIPGRIVHVAFYEQQGLWVVLYEPTPAVGY